MTMRVRPLIQSLRVLMDSWKETDHPRDDGGRFVSTTGAVLGHTSGGKAVDGPSAELVRAYELIDKEYGHGHVDFDAVSRLGAEARKLVQAHVQATKGYTAQDHKEAGDIQGAAWFKTKSNAEKTAHKALADEHRLKATGKRSDPNEGFGSIRSGTLGGPWGISGS